jgi:hypothetical protein
MGGRGQKVQPCRPDRIAASDALPIGSIGDPDQGSADHRDFMLTGATGRLQPLIAVAFGGTIFPIKGVGRIKFLLDPFQPGAQLDQPQFQGPPAGGDRCDIDLLHPVFLLRAGILLQAARPLP